MAKIINFGCRLNSYESQIIKEKTKDIDDNVLILNSCAVTNEAERKLRQNIRKYKKQNYKIILTGCAAQLNPMKYSNMDELDMVISNKEKLNIDKILKNQKDYKKTLNQKNSNLNIKYNKFEDKIFFEKENINYNDDKIFYSPIINDSDDNKNNLNYNNIITSFEGKNRAFIEIQNGCNHRCTFCIIPYARGNNRSVPFGVIAKQIENLLKNNYQEIVLTGVDITDYGKDISKYLSLSNLVSRILNLFPEIKRLRLSSVDVAEIDNDLKDMIIYEKRIMPYIHISVQSGNDLILKRMKRRHKREDVINFCQSILEKRTEIIFGSDIIIGFPTEDNNMFLDNISLIKEANLTLNHIFPFSAKDNTPASKMPQISGHIKKERFKIIKEFADNYYNNKIKSMIGQKGKILVEKDNIGKTENFITSKIENIQNNQLESKIINVEFTGIKDNMLLSKEI